MADREQGPSSITSFYARAMLHNAKQKFVGGTPIAGGPNSKRAMADERQVLDGILKRKKSFLSSPEWTTGVERTPTLSTKLTTTALQVAGTLERTDVLLAAKRPREADIVGLLTDLVRLERDLNGMLVEFYRSSGGDTTPYKLVSVSQYPEFEEGCEGLADIFPRVIKFPSFLSATTHAYVWVCLMPLQEAIMNVARLHPYPLVRPVNQDAILMAAVDDTANNFCQSIAYLAFTERSSSGVLSCAAPLYFAAAWYTHRRDLRRLAWCNVVRGFLQSKGLANGAEADSLNLQRPVLTWWMLSVYS